MKPRGKGVIVNVVGMAGVTHPAEYICGTTGNAALEAFTKGVGKGSIESRRARARHASPGDAHRPHHFF